MPRLHRRHRALLLSAILLVLGVVFGVPELFTPDDGSGPAATGDSNLTAAARADGTAGIAGSAPSSLSTQTLPRWDDGDPDVNLWHVFLGEINRQGEPTGFHARPGGVDPGSARVVDRRDGPNAVGVYTATVEIRDEGRWKRKFSSFFPDELDAEEVLRVIRTAFHASANPEAQPWEGPSGLGFRVQGYTSSRGGIATAFPIYVPSR